MLDSDTMTLDQAIQILEDEDETDPEFFEACRFALRVLLALQDLCGASGNTGAANGDHGIIKT